MLEGLGRAAPVAAAGVLGLEEPPRGTHRELAHLPAVHPLVLRLGGDGVGQFLEEKGLPWVPAQHSRQAWGARHAGQGLTARSP